jgi:hypothetical protein
MTSSKTILQAGKVSKSERFTKVHEPDDLAAVQRDVAEATALGDDVRKMIVGTSLDKQSEITALAKLPPVEQLKLAERAATGVPECGAPLLGSFLVAHFLPAGPGAGTLK